LTQRLKPQQLAIVTGNHVYQGCLCCVASHVAGEVCLVALANGERVAATYSNLSPVTMEQIEAGEVDFITPTQARQEFCDGTVCTCRRRMPRWRIGEISG
jgi:hypothetical protein